MLLDLQSVMNCPTKSVYQDQLIKFENTIYSEQGTQEFDYKTNKIHYKLAEYKLDGSLVNKQEYQNVRKITLTPSNMNISFGLFLILSSMKLNEKAVFRVNSLLRLSQYQLEQSNPEKIKFIDKEQEQQFKEEVFWIVSIEKITSIISASDYPLEDRLQKIKKFSIKGKQLFQEGKYQLAQEQFRQICAYSQNIPKQTKETMTDEQIQYFKDETSKSYSNQAICAAKLQEWSQVRDYTNSAISLYQKNEQPFKNFKAHFFRGRQLQERGLLEEAEEQFLQIKQNFATENLDEVNDQLKKIKQQKNSFQQKKIFEQMILKMSDKDQYEIEKEQQEKVKIFEQNKQKQKILQQTENGLISTEDFNNIQ